MEEMFGIIQELGRSPVAELVCNHECFAQTVENMFTLSFLVRDSKAYLEHDENMGFMAQIVDGRREGKGAPEVKGKRPDEQLQFVMSISMADWELMKKIVRREDCMVGGLRSSASVSQPATRKPPTAG
ncbi:hypothetical protein FOA52_015660 [Chlamydomonas sp. UWO 241]|nr:hypothetical protein FOA52_015660 [Chlamydomonas sp. UWO 241]